jgi:hypothetical protein
MAVALMPGAAAGASATAVADDRVGAADLVIRAADFVAGRAVATFAALVAVAGFFRVVAITVPIGRRHGGLW